MPVTLEVSLTAFGAPDKDAVRQLMTDDLERRCDALEASGTESFKDEANYCSSSTPGRPAAQRGQVTEHYLAIPAHGVVSVTMQHRGPMWIPVAYDVIAVTGTLAQTDPADLS